MENDEEYRHRSVLSGFIDDEDDDKIPILNSNKSPSKRSSVFNENEISGSRIVSSGELDPILGSSSERQDSTNAGEMSKTALKRNIFILVFILVALICALAVLLVVVLHMSHEIAEMKKHCQCKLPVVLDNRQ